MNKKNEKKYLYFTYTIMLFATFTMISVLISFLFIKNHNIRIFMEFIAFILGFFTYVLLAVRKKLVGGFITMGINIFIACILFLVILGYTFFYHNIIFDVIGKVLYD